MTFSEFDSAQKGDPHPDRDEANYPCINIAEKTRRNPTVAPLSGQGSQTGTDHHRDGHEEGNLPGDKLPEKARECAKHGDGQIAADRDPGWNL